MRHMMMMGGLHHGMAGFMVMGMIRRMVMKALIVGLLIAVAVLWVRQRDRQGW